MQKVGQKAVKFGGVTRIWATRHTSEGDAQESEARAARGTATLQPSRRLRLSANRAPSSHRRPKISPFIRSIAGAIHSASRAACTLDQSRRVGGHHVTSSVP